MHDPKQIFPQKHYPPALTTSLDGFADDREGESAPWNDLGCPLGLGLDVMDNRESRRPRHAPRRPMLPIRLRQKLISREHSIRKARRENWGNCYGCELHLGLELVATWYHSVPTYTDILDSRAMYKRSIYLV